MPLAEHSFPGAAKFGKQFISGCETMMVFEWRTWQESFSFHLCQRSEGRWKPLLLPCRDRLKNFFKKQLCGALGRREGGRWGVEWQGVRERRERECARMLVIGKLCKCICQRDFSGMWNQIIYKLKIGTEKAASRASLFLASSLGTCLFPLIQDSFLVFLQTIQGLLGHWNY